MPTQELKDFVEERLRAADPDVDLSDGSPYQLQVVDPIVSRFQPDPFEMDVEKFLTARLSQEFTDVNFREGGGVYDLLTKAANVLLDPMIREVQLIRQGQSLSRPELLAESEADALVANIFVSRVTGGLSTGTVRLYFNAPVALNISVSNVCYTAAGLRFVPTVLQGISAEAMLFNQSGGLYYFDIQVTAEEAGSEYNIGKEEVIGITNLNAAVLVKNLDRFEGGLDAETTDELVQKAETSITERSLVVARGVSARLRSQFEDLVHLQIVGMLDEEMKRDVLTGGDLGEILLSGVDGYTEDDGNGDALSYSFKTRYGDFTSVFGMVNFDLSPDEFYLMVSSVEYGNNASVPVVDLDHIVIPTVTFTHEDEGGMLVIVKATKPANLGPAEILALSGTDEVRISRAGEDETGMTWVLFRRPVLIKIESILGTGEIRLASPLPVDRPALIWSIHQRKLTLSDIPGGIVYSDVAEEITVSPDEVHIGGCTDFYVCGTGVESKELVVAAITDEAPVAKGTNLWCSLSAPEFVLAPGKDLPALGARPGHSLVIESGVNAGTYGILRVGRDSAGAYNENYLQVTPPLTSADPAMRYKVVDSIDIDLRRPRVIRGEGHDLETQQLSQTVTTTSAIDFLALGTEVGDTLEILAGSDKGEYSVSSIGGTGNRNLNLAAQMKSTTVNLSWELYKAYEGIEFPLVRVSSVDILDSSQQPTGYTVPYARPIDARSTAFSNAGRGTKISTADAITGIVGTVDLDALSYPLAPTVVGVKVNNGSTTSITLTGSGSKTEILNRINAAIFNIADTITIDGKSYLTLRSGDRWLQVTANAANANVGLSTGGEDNRRIKSAGNITDWTSAAYDLRTQTDVLYIKNGDNVGYYYLVSVAAGYILAVGFDEANGQVRFLQPNVDVSLAIGSRSYGKARVYFLEPTSFQVLGRWRPALKNTTTYPANKAISATGAATISEDEEEGTYFTVNIAGSPMRFFPDPELKHQLIPAPEEDVPNNLVTGPTLAVESSDTPIVDDLGKNSRNSAIDFLAREVRAGDLVDVTFQPIQGTRDIRSVASGGTIIYGTSGDFVGETLVLTLGENPPKTITFTDQIVDQDDVVDEINSAMGQVVAYIEELSGPKKLRLEADLRIIVHSNSTSLTLFGLPLTNTTNYAEGNIDGYYTVQTVGWAANPAKHYWLELNPAPVCGNAQAQHFVIYRAGMQRIHSTAMNSNEENGLYYMDVELVSEGVGDEWNLDQGELFSLTGYESDGYYLAVEDPRRSYSTEEEVRMVLSSRILTVGRSDRPDEATQLSNQNIQVNYDRSPLADSVQSFARSELERVLCASILVRHLQPHYINFELVYRGGSSADVVTTDVNEFLAGLGPDDRVEASDIQKLPMSRGADYVQNPIELLAIVHDEERNISVERSENYVTHGRLATFFPGTITVTRETATTL